MSIILVLALLFGAISPSPVQAQAANNRAVDGKVMDPQGLPITGARITVREKQGNTRKTAVSTDKFRVEGLPAGLYEVRVEADGFAPQTVSADLRTQTSASVEVHMELGRLQDQVIVSV